MSGICGILVRRTDVELDQSHLSPMVAAVDRSRSSGRQTWCNRIVGLGAVDKFGLTSGIRHKKIDNQDVVLAFYGNLYNSNEFLPTNECNLDLIRALLQLYVKEGVQFLNHLRGEFAIALWDGRDDRCYLATDRFRAHPLFYWNDSAKLVFSSSIRGILGCPFVNTPTIDPRAILDVMALSCVPTPRTIYKEIQKLPPGFLLTSKNGMTNLASYWDISFLNPDPRDEVALSGELKSLLREAVRIRLTSDWPHCHIGTYLSGGIDSSTVSGLIAEHTRGPVQSFSIGYGEEQFNELNYARIAVKHFGLDHHQHTVTPADTIAAIPVVLECFDEPFANASAIPTFICAKVAKERGVDLLYAGDGGDELFGGNERYSQQRLFEYYWKVPFWLRESVLKPVVHSLANKTNFDVLLKGVKYIKRASIPYPERISSYGFFYDVPVQDFFSHELLEMVGEDTAPFSTIAYYYHKAPARSELDRQLYIDLKVTISDNDLLKVTKTADAAGVAVRFPFLDHRVAEFAATIPADIKMCGTELRSFFKKTYADFLPPAVIAKKKHGFGLPIPIWLRTDKTLNDMLYDLVLSQRSVQRGYFQKNAVENLLQLHKTDNTSLYGTVLWHMMVVELWHRQYYDRLGWKDTTQIS